MKLLKYLETTPKHFVLWTGLLVVLLIGAADYLVGVDLALSIFYLMPIALVTWRVGKWYGVAFSIASALIGLSSDLSAKSTLPVLLPYWNTAVRLGFFVVIVYLLSLLKVSYRREKYSAQTDGLTGAMNRRFFLELLQWEVKRTHRYGHNLTLAYFDLDNFKIVNDRYGHRTGDKLLKSVTEAITEQIRSTDVIARLGGDEFALLLPETSYKSAQIVLLRLHRDLLETMQAQSLPVSLSIGAITFVSPPDSIDLMLEQVDRLMDAVKKSGKNGIKHELFDRSLIM